MEEQGEDEMNEEEGEDELEEICADLGDKPGDGSAMELHRKKSLMSLKKQMSLQSMRGGIQGNEGVIGEDGGIAKDSQDDESSVDGMRTR